MDPVDQLRRPHLVLSNVGANAVRAALVDDAGKSGEHIVGHEHVGIGAVVLLLLNVLVADSMDMPNPLGGISRRQLFQHGPQHILHIAHDRHVHTNILANLRGIDIDMHNFGVGGERRGLAGHPIIKAAAQVQQQVALLDSAVVMHPAMHARHTEG